MTENDVRPFEQVRVADRDAYVCPGCGQHPDRMTVESGVYASCDDDKCITDCWRWWEDD